MLIWDDARTTAQRYAQDTSTDGVAFLDLMMNVGYKDVLVALGRQVTEKEKTLDLVANARSVQVPPDLVFPKSMYVLDGSTIHPVTEEPSDQFWAARKSGQHTGIPEKFHYKPRFGIGGGVIELDPIPSSSSYDLVLTFEATQRDLSVTKYTTGTVSISQGSSTVTGAGTTFTEAMVDRYLIINTTSGDGLPYRISDYASATEIELENVYQGADVSGSSFQIVEMFNLPEDIQMLPVWYALWQHWDTKGNLVRAAKFEKQFTDGLSRGKKIHAVTTRDNTVGGEWQHPIFPQGSPSYFPDGLSS